MRVPKRRAPGKRLRALSRKRLAQYRRRPPDLNLRAHSHSRKSNQSQTTNIISSLRYYAPRAPFVVRALLVRMILRSYARARARAPSLSHRSVARGGESRAHAQAHNHRSKADRAYWKCMKAEPTLTERLRAHTQTRARASARSLSGSYTHARNERRVVSMRMSVYDPSASDTARAVARADCEPCVCARAPLVHLAPLAHIAIGFGARATT